MPGLLLGCCHVSVYERVALILNFSVTGTATLAVSNTLEVGKLLECCLAVLNSSVCGGCGRRRVLVRWWSG